MQPCHPAILRRPLRNLCRRMNSWPLSGPPPLPPAPAAFVLTSFYSSLHVSCFHGSSPSAVFFLCLFGLPDVVATGYFGSYPGITRSKKKKKKEKRQWKNFILEKNFHTCVPGCITERPKVSNAWLSNARPTKVQSIHFKCPRFCRVKLLP